MVAVAVVADPRHDGRRDPEPGQPGADVAGEPADRPHERRRRRERGPRRGGRQVDADPAEDERLDHRPAPLVIGGA